MMAANSECRLEGIRSRGMRVDEIFRVFLPRLHNATGGRNLPPSVLLRSACRPIEGIHTKTLGRLYPHPVRRDGGAVANVGVYPALGGDHYFIFVRV